MVKRIKNQNSPDCRKRAGWNNRHDCCTVLLQILGDPEGLVVHRVLANQTDVFEQALPNFVLEQKRTAQMGSRWSVNGQKSRPNSHSEGIMSEHLRQIFGILHEDGTRHCVGPPQKPIRGLFQRSPECLLQPDRRSLWNAPLSTMIRTSGLRVNGMVRILLGATQSRYFLAIAVRGSPPGSVLSPIFRPGGS